MKINKYDLKIIRAFFIALMMIFSMGCNKGTDFTNKIYFSQTVSSNIIPLTIDGERGVVSLNLVSAQLAKENLTANVSVLDASFLDGYNRENGTDFRMVPSSSIHLSSPTVSIPEGAAMSENVFTVMVSDWETYVDGSQYVVPVRLAGVGSSEILAGAEVFFISVGKVIHTVAARSMPGSNNTGFIIGDTLLQKGSLGMPNNITLEGKFILTNTLIVPGNWRSDLFEGFGMQVCVFNSGGVDIRFPNAAFMFREQPPASIGLNNWVHIAVTYQGGSVTLYINGEQVGSSVSYPNLPNSTLSLLGFTNGSAISEFRIWNHVRSRQQLRSFACAVDPSTEGLLSYWRFNEGEGNVISDVSGNGNHINASSNISWLADVRCP